MDKLKKIKYIYFDLDGTFLDGDKLVPAAHIKAVELLQKQGIKCGIATGRPYYLSLEIIKAVKWDLPMLSINGNLILDSQSKKVFSITTLSQSTVDKFIEYCQKNQINYLVYTKNNIQIKQFTYSKHIDWIYMNRDRQPQDCKTPLVNFTNHKIPIYKFLILTHELSPLQLQKIQNFLTTLPDVYLTKSQTNLYDVMPKGVDKGVGIKKVAQKGIIEIDKTLVIGDSDNDIPMLKIAAVAVAMKNANEKVKKYADIITKKSNSEKGILNFVENVLMK